MAQVNKEQIVKLLECGSRFFDVDGYPLKCIPSDDYDSVAHEILKLVNPAIKESYVLLKRKDERAFWTIEYGRNHEIDGFEVLYRCNNIEEMIAECERYNDTIINK